jgi:hypothetical protein
MQHLYGTLMNHMRAEIKMCVILFFLDHYTVSLLLLQVTIHRWNIKPNWHIFFWQQYKSLSIILYILN